MTLVSDKIDENSKAESIIPKTKLSVITNSNSILYYTVMNVQPKDIVNVYRGQKWHNILVLYVFCSPTGRIYATSQENGPE